MIIRSLTWFLTCRLTCAWRRVDVPIHAERTPVRGGVPGWSDVGERRLRFDNSKNKRSDAPPRLPLTSLSWLPRPSSARERFPAGAEQSGRVAPGVTLGTFPL